MAVHSNILHEPRQLIQRKLKYIFACFATLTVQKILFAQIDQLITDQNCVFANAQN